MRYTRAAYHVIGGGCGGVMGGFECGLGFDDSAGGACESVCIAIVVELGFLAHMVALGLLVLDSTTPFFNSISGPLFDCPLISLLFGLTLRHGRVVHRFVNDWHGGGFSGCGVRDGGRGLVG